MLLIVMIIITPPVVWSFVFLRKGCPHTLHWNDLFPLLLPQLSYCVDPFLRLPESSDAGLSRVAQYLGNHIMRMCMHINQTLRLLNV